jgi:hypothetical protein
MGKIPLVAGLAVVSVTVGAVTFTWLQSRHYEAAFASTSLGDAEDIVIERFGAPSYREPRNKTYARYASTPCSDRCESRLWWELSLLPGFEAWSVELGAGRTVEHTAHWVSP